MRTEMKQYEKQFPTKRTLVFRIGELKAKIAIWLFRRRLRQIRVGLKEWHVLQEKLSHGSSVGIDMEKRILFYQETLPKCKGALYVLPGVMMYFPQNIEIGYNVFINRGAFFTARARISIGDNVLIGPDTIFNSGEHIYSDPQKLIRDQGHHLGPIIIDDDVWISANVTVLPGVTIGKGSIVGAGAVVTKSVEPYSVVAGVPAKLIKYRGNRGL